MRTVIICLWNLVVDNCLIMLCPRMSAEAMVKMFGEMHKEVFSERNSNDISTTNDSQVFPPDGQVVIPTSLGILDSKSMMIACCSRIVFSNSKIEFALL